MPGKFGADEVQQIGLVSEVFSDDGFAAEVDVIVDQLAQSAPLALGDMKKNFINAESMSLRDYIELETERHNKTGTSEDSREAFKAFVEKREPQFKGC